VETTPLQISSSTTTIANTLNASTSNFSGVLTMLEGTPITLKDTANINYVDMKCVSTGYQVNNPSPSGSAIFNFNSVPAVEIGNSVTKVYNRLDVGGTATFNTYAPECGVTATSGNQLTNKTYVDNAVSGGSILGLDNIWTGTNNTFNNALSVGGTATFNTYAPECGVTATSGNQLTNKSYVDNNFVDKTTDQYIAGRKTFGNTISFQGGSGGNYSIVSDYGLQVDGKATFGGTATFNTYAPECGVTATSGNQLTNKSFVDNNFVTASSSYENIPQDIYGQKVFRSISGSNGVYFNDSIIVRDKIIISKQNVFNENLLYIYESDTSLNFEPNFNSNNYNFYTKNSQGATANTLKIEYDTSIFNSKLQINNALGVGGTATFNTYAPVCGITATSGNQLTNRDYVDNNFVNLTTDQTIAGDKIFNGNATYKGSGLFCNCPGEFSNLVHLRNYTHVYDIISPYTNYTQFYMNVNNFVIYPLAVSGSIQFFCRNSANVEVYTFSSSATSNTSLVPFIASNTATFGGTASFNTYAPVCDITATSGNQLTNKSYVDSKTYQVLNFSPTEVTNIKKSIIYRNAATITESSITAYLDNAPTTQQVYTFGKKIDNLWVVGVTGTNQIYYSTNGTSLSGTSNNNPFTNTNAHSVNALAWNGTRWVAVGDGYGKQINYSDDGLNWNSTNEKAVFGIDVNNVAVGNGVAWNGTNLLVAVGGAASNNTTFSTVAWSTNGITWFTVGSAHPFGTGSSGTGHGVAWNGNMWVAVGNGACQFAYSSDGKNWNRSESTNVFTNSGFGVAWNGQMWVAVGNGSNQWAHSYDGMNWVGNGSPFGSGNSGYGVAWNGKLWVLVGKSDTNTICYSYDGLNCTSANSPMFNGTSYYANSIAWSGSMWVAGGYSNTNSNMAYSIDGINWYSIDGGQNRIVKSVAFNSTRKNTITFNNSKTGSINLYSGSFSLNSGDQLDVICDSYYNTGFTNCSISIDN
jgi:hypothetical protein